MKQGNGLRGKLSQKKLKKTDFPKMLLLVKKKTVFQITFGILFKDANFFLNDCNLHLIVICIFQTSDALFHL